VDVVWPILQGGYSARALLGALPLSDLATDPYLSPASLALASPRGLFTGFPPTCIVTGEAEQTLGPMQTARDRLVCDVGEENVRYLEYRDANHAFLSLPLFKTQRARAYGDMGRWIVEVYPSLL
jgi:acetyl esterase/lipase